MLRLWTSLCLLVSLFGAAWAQISTNALVVFDPAYTESKPQLLSSIEAFGASQGIELEFKNYTDETLDLFVSGEIRYDHLIVLPTTKKALAKKNFNSRKMVEFFNANGNVLIVDGSTNNMPEEIRTFLNEVGIYPSPKGYKLIDHFQSNPDTKRVVIKEENFVNSKIQPKYELEYSGASALLGNGPYLIPIIRAPATSFSINTADMDDSITQDRTWTFGEQGFLAVGLQGLNNARLAWIGSEDLITNELLQWNFGIKNVLKLQFVQHYKENEPEKLNTTLYKVKDQVIYTVGVSQWQKDKWVPYEIENDEDQLQLSFKMLDPYQRLNLKPLGPASSKEDNTDLDTYIYYANFTIPDQHGMFTFDLDYKRAGLSFIEDKTIVAVRHLANDEFKRSWDITNAWLYVACACLVSLSWFVFVINFIFIGVDNKQKKNQ